MEIENEEGKELLDLALQGFQTFPGWAQGLVAFVAIALCVLILIQFPKVRETFATAVGRFFANVGDTLTVEAGGLRMRVGALFGRGNRGSQRTTSTDTQTDGQTNLTDMTTQTRTEQTQDTTAPSTDQQDNETDTQDTNPHSTDQQDNETDRRDTFRTPKSILKRTRFGLDQGEWEKKLSQANETPNWTTFATVGSELGSASASVRPKIASTKVNRFAGVSNSSTQSPFDNPVNLSSVTDPSTADTSEVFSTPLNTALLTPTASHSDDCCCVWCVKNFGPQQYFSEPAMPSGIPSLTPISAILINTENGPRVRILEIESCNGTSRLVEHDVTPFEPETATLSDDSAIDQSHFELPTSHEQFLPSAHSSAVINEVSAVDGAGDKESPTGPVDFALDFSIHDEVEKFEQRETAAERKERIRVERERLQLVRVERQRRKEEELARIERAKLDNLLQNPHETRNKQKLYEKVSK